MVRAKLDKIDRKILKSLQSDGRITNVDLAKGAGISAPPCLRRVRTLEEQGYIHSYHAKIDHAAMGYPVTVFALVKLTSQAKEDLGEFESYINALPMVRECHLLAGEVDYVLKIVSKDWDSYQTFHAEKLTNAPHVISVKSSLSIRTGKDEPGVPINDD
ncbi:MAG: Lrp/AsnC family transcriptional regulator [Alphaproteobacteria bacterium]|nr:Lrp/AsnC family transcriptional regulator [Alphaproteobacteria bacterium]